MKGNILLLIGGIILAIVIFSNNDSKEGNADTFIKEQYHIINLLDPSGTTKGKNWPWPDKLFFEQQITFLENNGGGVLEVYNLSYSVPKPLKLIIEPKMPIPNVYEKGELFVKKIKQKNKEVINRNDNSIRIFMKNIETQIINYKPEKRSDYSYIEKHIKTINKALNLPQYAAYEKFLFMYTDFIDDTPNRDAHIINPTIINELVFKAHVSVCDYNKNHNIINAIEIPNHYDFIGILESTN